MEDTEKGSIEDDIVRAREGVSLHIDELDRRLRSTLDAGNYTPQIIAAGAATGFLIAFGLPKILRRAIQIGIPAFVAYKMARSKWHPDSEAS